MRKWRRRSTPTFVQTAVNDLLEEPTTYRRWSALQLARWQIQNTRPPSDLFLSSRNMIGCKLMVPSNTSSKAAWQKIQTETRRDCFDARTLLCNSISAVRQNVSMSPGTRTSAHDLITSWYLQRAVSARRRLLALRVSESRRPLRQRQWPEINAAIGRSHDATHQVPISRPRRREHLMSDLYDTDILSVSERQAGVCCVAAPPVSGDDERADWPNIVEEIEDVGRASCGPVGPSCGRRCDTC